MRACAAAALTHPLTPRLLLPLALALLLLRLPLPPVRCRSMAGSRDGSSGIILDEHPLDAYFRELRDRRRRELARRRLAALKAMQVGGGGGASGRAGGWGWGWVGELVQVCVCVWWVGGGGARLLVAWHVDCCPITQALAFCITVHARTQRHATRPCMASAAAADPARPLSLNPNPCLRQAMVELHRRTMFVGGKQPSTSSQEGAAEGSEGDREAAARMDELVAGWRELQVRGGAVRRRYSAPRARQCGAVAVLRVSSGTAQRRSVGGSSPAP